MVEFEFNEEGMRQLEEQLREQLGQIQIPLGGSEEDAIRSVTQQLLDKGLEPNDEAVQQIVREARGG